MKNRQRNNETKQDGEGEGINDFAETNPTPDIRLREAKEKSKIRKTKPGQLTAGNENI